MSLSISIYLYSTIYLSIYLSLIDSPKHSSDILASDTANKKWKEEKEDFLVWFQAAILGTIYYTLKYIHIHTYIPNSVYFPV